MVKTGYLYHNYVNQINFQQLFDNMVKPSYLYSCIIMLMNKPCFKN